MTKVLVVAAHPDDEVLGCAGTLALHSLKGDEVEILFMTDGESARANHTDQSIARQLAAKAAAKKLGVTNITFLDFPDNAMDSFALLAIVQQLENHINKIQPQLIYTHFGGDLNIDHRLTYQAVMTACRPQPHQSVRAIYCFEVPSSTEWATSIEPAFRPTLFIDISDVQLQVTIALKCYADELRPWPHSRSMEAINARQQWRGSSVGLPAAEAFMIERELRRL